MDGIFNGNAPFQGVMYRVCSSRSTASDCTFQPFNLIKIKTLIRNHTIAKCFLFVDFTTMFSGTILFLNSLILSAWSLFFTDCIKENCTLVSFLLVLSKFIPWIVFYWNLETWSRFFYEVSLLLLIITDFTFKIP